MSDKDYIHICWFYIQWKILGACLFVGLAILFLFFQRDLQSWFDQVLGRKPDMVTFAYNDKALSSFEGNVRILNSEHQKVYEGMYFDGACQGNGVIFDGEGHIIYQGWLEQNVMQDDHGRLFYPDGTLAYEGQIKNNQKDGAGVQYREDGTLLYNGIFQLDQLNGYGKEYNEREELIYEGEYLNGQRHGHGVAYEHSSRKRMVYQGEYAFDQPQGQGTFYDALGKAYYTGAVFQGHMDLTSFLPSTLADLEEAFHTPYDIYCYNMQVLVNKDGKQEMAVIQKTAIVYPLHKLIFFTQYPLTFDKADEVWKRSDAVEASEIVMESVEMVDGNLDNPNMTFLNSLIDDAWMNRANARVIEKNMDYFDVFALFFSSARSAAVYKNSFEVTAHGNRIYELNYLAPLAKSRRTMYQVTNYSVGYGHPSSSKECLYSQLVDEHLEVRVK